MKNTAPGKDGIPNAAWTHSGVCGLNYSIQLFDAHAGGNPRPPDINDGLFVFIPKGEEKDDNMQAPGVVFRHPSETRPLTLKNVDNKIIAGLINWCISPVVKACAIFMQRGFVGDRQLLQNAVDLDQASRVAAHLYSAGDDACKFTEILQQTRY